MNIISFESINKNIDFGAKYVNLFQAFINSTQSYDFDNYRILLCIMTKILFYEGEHIQNLFNDMVYDKYFFKNLNRELNYQIVLCIYLSNKYELCQRCSEITDITKLTIQFLQLLGEGFNVTFHENILKGMIKSKDKGGDRLLGNKYNTVTYNEINDFDDNESSDHSSSVFEENNFLSKKNEEIKEISQKILTKETSYIDPKYTIYETAIYNLKRIFHLMELNNLLEGEAGFDKLCVLSTNIIDFLIEYIDTLGDLTYIIDENFKDLFFGTGKYDKITSLNNLNSIGILPIFTMRIKEDFEYYDEKSFNKYELRKTMLAYMKLKYFQLLKAYLQIGNKSEFVKLLLAEHLGPLQLYEEILYYMKELINNLVHKDYNKYNHLLNIDNAKIYRNKLNELYMYEDEFRTSVEISVVFQISIVIEILQETYRITMLKDHFEKDIPQEKFDYLADIQLDNEINDFNNIERQNGNIRNLNTNIIKNNLNQIKESSTNRQTDVNKLMKEEYEGSDVFLIDETNKNLFAKNYNGISLEQTNNSRTPYENIRLNYRNNKLKAITRDNILNLSLSQKKIDKLDKNDTIFESKFSKAVYKFLSSLVSKVEIKMFDDNEDSENDGKDKQKHLNSLTKEITKKIIERKKKDTVLANINYDNNLDNNIDNEPDEYENYIEKNEKEEDEKKEKYVFFIKPYLSFHLSEQTKTYFLYNVNRSLVINKYIEMISYCDYFLFEMMYNMKYINKSKILKGLSKISFYVLQVINYILVLVENALLMYHYYRGYSLSYNEYYLEYESEKYKRFIDVVVIIIVKLLLILFTFFVWFYINFIITFERNIIVKEDKNFIFRRLGQPNQHITHPTIFKYFREEGNLLETIS